MPRYDFTCPDGHTFELVAGLDTEKVKCQQCRRLARRSEVNAPGIIFKGPGFTKSVVVVPPRAPQGQTSPEEHFELLDDFAKATHDYDTNTRPYLREEAGLDPRE